MKAFMGAVMLLSLTAGATAFSATEAEANCVMQRQCRPAYKHVRQVRYQQDCNTFRIGGQIQRSCRNRPVTHMVPVAYQDCSQVRRVCNSLGSLIGSGKRRDGRAR